MSNIYHTEPPTQGKVVIKTSFGDIDIELWPKEAPLACRNFIQLALEGYYDNTEVVRAVKGFMVQMGDPTGTGEGGTSIWGKPFKDEIHGRIKFNHRGQLAMANSNRPHSNQSQFFITLDACDWLNGKHSIFGKVTGSTMFNVIRMGEVEVGENDKPVEEIKILSVEVLSNPFDDIVPRVTKKVIHESPSIKPKDENIKAVKNKKLLSFAADDDENDSDGDGCVKVKFRSVHDLKKKNKKHQESASFSDSKVRENIDEISTKDDPEKDLKEKILQKHVEHLQNQAKLFNHNETNGNDGEDDADIGLMDRETWTKMDREHSRDSEMQKKSEEFLKTRAELLKSRRAVNVMTGAEATQYRQETAYRELATPLEQRRMKYVKRKNEFGDRSEETLAKLQKFTENLRSRKTLNKSSESTKDSAQTYHGQVLERDSDEDDDNKDWFVGKLKCKKHIDEQYRYNDNAKDRRGDDYVVVDPKRNTSL